MKRLILAFVIIGSALLIPAVSAQETATPTPRPGSSYVIFDDIYVRGGPGESYQPVGALQAGVLLRPVSRSVDGNWILIAYNRGFGWVRRDLAVWGLDVDALPIIEETDLTPTAPPGDATATFFLPTATPTGNWVNTGGLGAFMRTGPGLHYAIYGEIDDGTSVDPVGRSEDATWILLRRTGGFAWINRALVSWAVDLEPLPILRINALTPSATFTGTLTPSATLTPTETATSTATATITLSPTASDTSTATLTLTPTVTSSATSPLTATLTITPTATQTSTFTPSPTDTVTPSLTPSRTNTAVPTETPLLTVTPSPSPTPSDTSAPTLVAQAVVPTDTPPPTETAALTPVSATVTASLTETPRPTLTFTPSVTPSLTASATFTYTATITAMPPTSTIDTGFLLTGTAIMVEVHRRETATALLLPTATPTEALLSLGAMNSTGTAIFDEINRRATETSAAAVPSPTVEGTAIAAVPQGVESSSNTAIISESAGGIAPELLVGGGVLLLVIGYAGLYWRGASGVERYAGGFVIDRCPTCGHGTLHLETTVTRSLGIARARYTVRCSECRSVLRGAGVRRWRYAVDRVENPSLYERYNNKIIEESELARLTPGVGVTQSPHVRPPTYIDSEDEDTPR